MNERDVGLPTHIGIIMDGNRRWAVGRGLRPWRGHAMGQETLRRVTRYAFNNGVKYLTVYAFSTENWKRSEEEVSFLMRRTSLAVKKYLKEFVEGGVKVCFLGVREGLSRSVLKAINEAEEKTAHNTKATLGICFNYGGMQEMADATKQVVLRGVRVEDITPQDLADCLYHPQIPPVDLLIRTGGEKRLSNFMLGRSAYAELYFSDVLWPDFSEDELQAAMDEYASRQRRFGG